MNQPVSSSTGPATASSTLKQWPWRRAHLCPAGTFGSRWAASKRNSCTRRTFMVKPLPPALYSEPGCQGTAMYIVLSKQPRKVNRNKSNRFRAKLKAKDKARRKRVYNQA